MKSFEIDFEKLAGRIRLCHSAELLGEHLLEILKTIMVMGQPWPMEHNMSLEPWSRAS